MVIECPGCGFENDEDSRFCGGCSSPLEILQPPTTLIEGKYRVVKVIGSGRRRWIYRIFDTVQKRHLRLVQVRANKDEISPLLKKASDLKAVLSSVGMVDFFPSENSLVFLFKSPMGIDLYEYMRNNNLKLVNYEKIIQWMVSMLKITSLFHSTNPPTVLAEICPSTFAVDFSNKLFLWDPGVTFLTGNYRSLEKYVVPGYAAPEILSGKTPGPEADVYSIAAVCFFLLTGIDPADDPSIFSNSLRVGKYNPGCPIELDRLISSMLQEDPDRRPSPAERVVQKAEQLTQKGDAARTLLTRGIGSYNQGKFDKALKDFTSCILMNPDMEVAYFWRGMVNASRENYQAALDDFTRAADLYPGYQEAYYQQGLALINMGQNDEAVQAFDLAISLDPDDPRSYVGKGLAFQNIDRLEKAIKNFDHAIELDPGDPETYHLRALAHYEMGRMNKAVSDYDRAIQIDPRDTFALLGRALANSNLGNLKQALQDLDTAIEINPAYASAYLERGVILNALKMFRTAALDLDRSIDLDPENPDAYYYRAWARFELGNYAEALEDVNKAVEMSPDVPEYYDLRSKVLYRLGKSEESARDREKHRQMTGEKTN